MIKLFASLLLLLVWFSCYGQYDKNFDISFDSDLTTSKSIKKLNRHHTDTTNDISSVEIRRKIWRLRDTDNIDECNCKLFEDSIKISFPISTGYTIKIPALIIFPDSSYYGKYYFWSDYDEYSGSHDTIVIANYSHLILDKFSLSTNDTIYGDFSIKLEPYVKSDKNSKLITKGVFRCVLNDQVELDKDDY